MLASGLHHIEAPDLARWSAALAAPQAEHSLAQTETEHVEGTMVGGDVDVCDGSVFNFEEPESAG